MLLHSVKARAKRNGLDFDLTPEDILPWPTHCQVFGVPLQFDCSRHVAEYSPSIDRHDNRLGYVKGNVRVISRRANILKNSATVDELRAVVQYLEHDC
jgi:hypothetical protein